MGHSNESVILSQSHFYSENCLTFASATARLRLSYSLTPWVNRRPPPTDSSAMTPHSRYPLVASSVIVLLGTVTFAAEPDGAQLYKTKCASCHGPQGEGTKKYMARLEGDHSVAKLADIIQKTMPESAPGTLDDKESKAIAEYIYQAFYSRIARERNRPARIELARLTVRQYRNTIADVVGSFRAPTRIGNERGLKAEYFKGRRMRPQERVEQRIDPNIGFQFGTNAPIPDKLDPAEFCIRWTGALLVEHTGEYEFTLRTEHAARLWLNDMRKPLIDAWVKSGNDTEYRETIYLVAGRAYALQVEYTKAKQGVDDSNKNKAKPKPVASSMTLLWKLPHRSREIVPTRNLAPTSASEVYVCGVPFPADDKSYGWERGTTVSKEWDEATTEAAIDAANYIVANIDELTGIRRGGRRPNSGLGNPSQINLDGNKDEPVAKDRAAKFQAFALSFAERAYRHPLTAEQKAAIERQFTPTRDDETNLKRALLLVLKSPHFLYREVGASAESYEVAARLSFGLWDSIPDAELLSAAARGQLASPEQIARQAERMLADPRARVKLRDFLLSWLKLDEGHDLAKDTKKFPGFTEEIISDLRTSIELFLHDVVWSESSDYRQLLLSDELLLNGRLAKFYGVDLPAEADFTRVKVDAGKRAGVLTHPYLMTTFAHAGESSPIHRGVFLARGVLGLALRPPPEAVAPLAPDLHPDLTTRERVNLQTRPAQCMTCHGVINPLGFTLEQFDAVGRFRDQEKGKPIDATGTYQTRSGKVVQVNGARELAKFLASSDEAHAAFVEQMFHALVQQPVRAYGATTQAELQRKFTDSGYNMRKLAVEILTTAAPRSRQANAGR